MRRRRRRRRRSRCHEIAVSHARATGGGPGVFSWVDERREGSPGRTLGNIDRAENTYSPCPPSSVPEKNKK